MSRSYNAQTISTSADQILPYTLGRRGFVIKNNGNVIVYVGFDSSVTATTGIPILPQDSFVITGDSDVFRGKVYGITSTGSADVRWWDWTL